MVIKKLLFRTSFITAFIGIVFYFLMKDRFGKSKWFEPLSYIYFIFIIGSEIVIWDLILLNGNFWIEAENHFFQLIYFIYLFLNLSLVITFPIFLGLAIIKIARHVLRKKNHKESSPRKAILETRKSFLKKSLIATGALLEFSPAIGTVGFISTMILGSREILLERLTVKIPNLHEDMKGFKIIQISDVHIGPSISDQYLEYCLDIIKNIEADLLVITGDLIDISNFYIPKVGSFIYRLQSQFKDRILYIPGNHEYFDNAEVFFNKIHSNELSILRNKSQAIIRGKGGLNLIGLDYPWPYRRISEERIYKSKKFWEIAIRGTNEDYPNIVLNHDPEDFIWMKDEKIALMLSGHTHGGHVKFTDERESILSPLSLVFKYYNGYYKEGESQLYVNRGMGNTFPIRVKCPPEITLLELI